MQKRGAAKKGQGGGRMGEDGEEARRDSGWGEVDGGGWDEVGGEPSRC